MGAPGSLGWGWKEPNTHVFLEHLAEALPALRYVHVMRDGVEMAFSGNQAQLHNWHALYGVERPAHASEAPRASLRYWLRANERALSPLGAYHSLMYGREMYFDLARTKRELDWAPKFSNAEMFCESYDWYLAHRDEVLRRHHASHHRSPVKQGVLRAVSVGLGVLPGLRA